MAVASLAFGRGRDNGFDTQIGHQVAVVRFVVDHVHPKETQLHAFASAGIDDSGCVAIGHLGVDGVAVREGLLQRGRQVRFGGSGSFNVGGFLLAFGGAAEI
jgi:hypothetical protein